MLRGIIAGGLWGAVIGFVVLALTSQLADWRDLTPAVAEGSLPDEMRPVEPTVTGDQAPSVIAGGDTVPRVAQETPLVAGGTAPDASAPDTTPPAPPVTAAPPAAPEPVAENADAPRIASAPAAPAPPTPEVRTSFRPSETERLPTVGSPALAPASTGPEALAEIAVPDVPETPGPEAPVATGAPGAPIIVAEAPSTTVPDVAPGSELPPAAPAAPEPIAESPAPEPVPEAGAEPETETARLAPLPDPAPAIAAAPVVPAPVPETAPDTAPVSPAASSPGKPDPVTEPAPSPVAESPSVPAPVAEAPPAPAAPESAGRPAIVSPSPDPAAPDDPGLEPRRIELAEAGGDQRLPGTRVNRLPRIGDEVELGEPPVPPAPEPQSETPAPDGAPALLRNRVPFDAPEGAARIAVVLVEADTAGPRLFVPGDMAAPVTIAVPAGRPDARSLAEAQRRSGHEIVLIPDLPPRATARDVEVALPVTLEAIPLAVALLDGGDRGFQGDRGATESVIAAADAAGLGVITYSRGFNTAQQMAEREGVPAALVFRTIDQPDDARAVVRALDQAAFRARQEGRIVLVGPARDTVVAGVMAWAEENADGDVVLAPVSAVLLPEE